MADSDRPDEAAIRTDFDSALEAWLPDDASISEEDALLAIAFRASNKDRMIGKITARQIVSQFKLQGFVIIARQWNAEGRKRNGISPGDWLIAEGEVFRALLQREVTVLAMPRTAEFEVLLEKLDGTLFGFVADNELDQVRIRDTSADQLSRMVRNEILTEQQALRLYMMEMQFRHGIDFLMKIAIAALEKRRKGDDSLIDIHKPFPVSVIIETLSLEPFLGTEKVGVETVQSQCPKCDEWHDFDLNPDDGDGIGEDAYYRINCPYCEKCFEVNCYGEVVKDYTCETRCPRCGERHECDLDPDDVWDYGETWYINCPSCDNYFGVNEHGEVVKSYDIDVECSHCHHNFAISEPVLDPFTFHCPECGAETICLSSHKLEDGEKIPVKWHRDYNDMPSLDVPPDYSPVYLHDVPPETLTAMLQWILDHKEKVRPDILERLVPAIEFDIRLRTGDLDFS